VSSTRVAAVVLAAGASVRMGAAKPLVRWRGLPMVGHVIAAVRDGGCDPIVVIEGAHALPDDAIAGARRVVHAQWALGPLSSVQAGLRALDGRESGVLIATVDRPHLAAATVRALLDAHAGDREAVLQPAFRGRRGHPVLLPAKQRDALLALDPTASLRDLLDRPELAALRRSIAVDDPAVLDNIDTPADLARLGG
jgi:molybdenum cofactor cytidylyltransferase